MVHVPPFVKKGSSPRLRCLVDDLGNPPAQLSVHEDVFPQAIAEVVVEENEIAFTYQTGNVAVIANASMRCSAGMEEVEHATFVSWYGDYSLLIMTI